ncbi:MAG TPA: NAD(+)/NADH kinase [Chloroflexota bacterium]|nr:NAD(+)/NADH kinase [Chloroflexota bacterium]
MMRVALIHQPYRPETGQCARDAAGWLESQHCKSQLLSAFELDRHDPTPFGLALSFGGDGTTLRTARWASGAGLPIVPVGMGTLSFLAELVPGQVEDSLGPYLAGDYWRDERAMLHVQVEGSAPHRALNDVVVARGAALRAVSIELAVEGQRVTRFTSDGVVVATATGSTAYALAAGGPVLAPDLRDIVVVPIAGHLSAVRSLVLPESVEIELRLVRTQPGVLSVDGQVDGDLPVDWPVSIRLATERTVFARRGDRRAFYAHLTTRLRRD